MYAEDDDVVDAEMVEEEEEEPKAFSVFDSPAEEMRFNSKYQGKWYTVYKSNWTYTRYGKTGAWNKAFRMPEEEYQKREKELIQKWRSKKRRLRQKHGMGQRWPNGKLIHLTKLQGSPFTRRFCGEKYVGRAPWTYSPNEVEARERKQRAYELRRKLELEAEKKRVMRMRELGIWLGDPSWKRPWEPKVDYVDP